MSARLTTSRTTGQKASWQSRRPFWRCDKCSSKAACCQQNIPIWFGPRLRLRANKQLWLFLLTKKKIDTSISTKPVSTIASYPHVISPCYTPIIIKILGYIYVSTSSTWSHIPLYHVSHNHNWFYLPLLIFTYLCFPCWYMSTMHVKNDLYIPFMVAYIFNDINSLSSWVGFTPIRYHQIYPHETITFIR